VTRRPLQHIHLGQPRLIYSNYVYGKRISGITLDCEAVFFRFNVRADDFGNLPANPRQLRKETEGLRDWTDDQVQDWTLQMERKGLIRLYLVRGDWYLHILNFTPLQPPLNGIGTRKYPISPWEIDDDDALVIQSADQPAVRDARGASTARSSAQGTSDLDLKDHHEKVRTDQELLFPEDEAKRAREQAAQRRALFIELFNFWVDTTKQDKQRTKLTRIRKYKLNQRLFVEKDSTVEEIKLAIVGCGLDEWSMGKNERNRPFNDLELICRSRDKIEFFMEKAHRLQKAPEDKRKKAEEAKARWRGQGQ